MSQGVAFYKNSIFVFVINDIIVTIIHSKVNSRDVDAAINVLDPLRVGRSVHVCLVNNVLVGFQVERAWNVLQLILGRFLEYLIFPY